MKLLRLIPICALFLGFFLLLTAQNQLSVSIEQVLAIGDSYEDLLYQRPGLTTDNQGNIYITDMENNLIKKFDLNGELIIETGLKYKRPAGLQGPSLIKYHDGKIYVSEVYSAGILIYNEELEYQSRIPILFTVTDFSFLPGEQIAVTALKRDYEERNFISCIYIFDFEGKELDKIVYARDSRLMMMNMVNFLVDRGEEFVMVYTWQDKIEKLTKKKEAEEGETEVKEGEEESDGIEILWTQTLLEQRKVRIKSENDSKATFGEYPAEAVYKSLAFDNRGYILVLGGHLSENRNRDIYILRGNGQYLTTVTLPEPAHAIHVDRNNFLYARSAKGASFRKYALKYFYE